MTASYLDIGVNLLDDMFQGSYHGKQKHEGDLPLVLERARKVGVKQFITTAGTLSEALSAIELSAKHDDVYCTVGVHPTRAGEFEREEEPSGEDYMKQLADLVATNSRKAGGKVVAIGECGLDYDRLHFCGKEVQKKWFRRQFELAEASGLPMFLHMRAACDDFLEIVKEHEHRIVGGVVHSFTGTAEEARRIVAETKLFIGVNGCSLKTEENLEAVKAIPVDRLMMDSDAPWCNIRPSSAASKFVTTKWPVKKKERFEMGVMVKDRNEPAGIVQVAEAMAGVLEMHLEEVADQVFANSTSLFFP